MTHSAIAFNINDNVRVKLTALGHEILRRNHEKLFLGSKQAPTYQPPQEDAEGFSSWPLWHLMEQFGPHCYTGADLPFDTNIEFALQKSSKPAKRASFDALPLGARFRYPGDTRTWVKLADGGTGTIARWDGPILNYLGQPVLAFEESEEARRRAQVEILDT